MKKVCDEYLIPAAKETAKQLLRGRGRRLLSDLGEVIESVAEESAALGASAIERTEQALVSVLQPPPFLRAPLPTPEAGAAASPAFYTANSADPPPRAEGGAELLNTALEKLIDAHPASPQRASLRSVDSRTAVQRIRDCAVARARSSPFTRAHSQLVLRDDEDEPCSNSWNWTGPAREPIGVHARQGRSHRPAASQKFSKKEMPSKRFDVFMSSGHETPLGGAPRRSTRASGAFKAVHAAEDHAPARNDVAKATSESPPRRKLEDQTIYACPDGVVIFAAPKLFGSEDLLVSASSFASGGDGAGQKHKAD